MSENFWNKLTKTFSNPQPEERQVVGSTKSGKKNTIFAEMTEKQAKDAGVLELFKKVDSNGDHMISQDEFNVIDKDGDGKVSQDEINTFEQNYKPKKQASEEETQETENNEQTSETERSNNNAPTKTGGAIAEVAATVVSNTSEAEEQNNEESGLGKGIAGITEVILPNITEDESNDEENVISKLITSLGEEIDKAKKNSKINDILENPEEYLTDDVNDKNNIALINEIINNDNAEQIKKLLDVVPESLKELVKNAIMNANLSDKTMDALHTYFNDLEGNDCDSIESACIDDDGNISLEKTLTFIGMDLGNGTTTRNGVRFAELYNQKMESEMMSAETDEDIADIQSRYKATYTELVQKTVGTDSKDAEMLLTSLPRMVESQLVSNEEAICILLNASESDNRENNNTILRHLINYDTYMTENVDDFNNQRIIDAIIRSKDEDLIKTLIDRKPDMKDYIVSQLEERSEVDEEYSKILNNIGIGQEQNEENSSKISFLEEIYEALSSDDGMETVANKIKSLAENDNISTVEKAGMISDIINYCSENEINLPNSVLNEIKTNIGSFVDFSNGDYMQLSNAEKFIILEILAEADFESFKRFAATSGIEQSNILDIFETALEDKNIGLDNDIEDAWRNTLDEMLENDGVNDPDNQAKFDKNIFNEKLEELRAIIPEEMDQDISFNSLSDEDKALIISIIEKGDPQAFINWALNSGIDRDNIQNIFNEALNIANLPQEEFEEWDNAITYGIGCAHLQNNKGHNNGEVDGDSDENGDNSLIGGTKLDKEIDDIVNDPNQSYQEKRNRLLALGLDDNEINQHIGNEEPTPTPDIDLNNSNSGNDYGNNGNSHSGSSYDGNSGSSYGGNSSSSGSSSSSSNGGNSGSSYGGNSGYSNGGYSYGNSYYQEQSNNNSTVYNYSTNTFTYNTSNTNSTTSTDRTNSNLSGMSNLYSEKWNNNFNIPSGVASHDIESAFELEMRKNPKIAQVFHALHQVTGGKKLNQLDSKGICNVIKFLASGQLSSLQKLENIFKKHINNHFTRMSVDNLCMEYIHGEKEVKDYIKENRFVTTPMLIGYFTMHRQELDKAPDSIKQEIEEYKDRHSSNKNFGVADNLASFVSEISKSNSLKSRF